MALVRHKEERIVALLTPFLQQLPELVAGIIAAVQQRDLNRALREVHTLKGTVANLGARALPVFLSETERMLRENEFDELEAWNRQFNELVDAMTEEMSTYLVQYHAGINAKC